MKTLGYYNGKIDDLEKMTVPMLDRACYFGDGVYDVTYCRNRVIYALDEHIDRFLQSAAALRMPCPMGRSELSELLRSLVQKTDSGDLWVYFQLTRGTELRNHAFPVEGTPNLWVMLKPGQIKDTYKTLRCITHPDVRSKLCNVKTLNLIPNVLATQAAVEAGVDECVLHRDGIVTECAHSNVSILTGGRLLTHPADEYILAGTGRAHLLAACRHFGIPVEERTYTLDELRGADEILMTSASALCMRIVELDREPIGGRDEGTVRRIQDYLANDFLTATAG